MSLIFIPYLFLNFKYKIFYLFYFPIFIIYFLLDNNNFLKPYFHYSAYLIALLFFIAKIEIFQSRKKVLAYIFFNILMTVNFLNPLFYSTNFELVKNYNFQNFINYNKYQKLDAFLSDINIPTTEPVTVSNNLLHYKIINRNHILVVGTNLHLTKSYSKCKKQNKVCEINSKYLILNLHDYFQNKDFIFNETSFKIIKENNEFIFIKK